MSLHNVYFHCLLFTAFHFLPFIAFPCIVFSENTFPPVNPYGDAEMAVGVQISQKPSRM